MGAVSKVSDLGEFGLIQQLAGVLHVKGPADMVLGIGDDAAVWRLGDDYVIATSDALVEGVHFLVGVEPWRDVGWKALAVNLSDIAAMGGTPLFALVTLGLLRDTRLESMEALYHGLRDCAREYEVTIVGGDIVRARQVTVSVTIIGRAERKNREPLILRRDGARPGDVIAVTGTLGDSAAGLRRLREGFMPKDPLARVHLRPRPQLAVGQQAVQAGLSCGIDVSDGLLQDIGHVCGASGLWADIEASAVPLSQALKGVVSPEEALALACNGGEDYQLVLVGPEETMKELKANLAGVRLTVIGRMRDGEPQRVRLQGKDGHELRLETQGWDQLRERK